MIMPEKPTSGERLFYLLAGIAGGYLFKALMDEFKEMEIYRLMQEEEEQNEQEGGKW